VTPSHQPEPPAATLAPEPTPTSGNLRYLLPELFPEGFVVLSAEQADADGFSLSLRGTGALANSGSIIRIAGGEPARATVESNRPGGRGALIEPVMVRRQVGTIATSGFGYTVAWIEDGHPYTVSGDHLDRDQIIAFADALVGLDVATWQEQVAAAQAGTPTQGLDRDAALRLLIDRIAQAQLYDSWTTRDCLSYLVEREDAHVFEIAVREKHGEPCRGDPNSAPIVDRFLVSDDTMILWLNPQGEYVEFDQAKTLRQRP
jgi:hypothetical protein